MARRIVLSFCENLAELGMPRSHPEADMWFRELSDKDQLKVSNKLISIMLRDHNMSKHDGK